MTKKVTVNLFDVSWSEKTQQLSRTLEEFDQLPLEERWRGDFRLDVIKNIPAGVALPCDTIFIDFAKSRDLGPGKLATASPVADVGLAANEFFGEETAALYVPSKKWLLALNNHYGVGPSGMATYLNGLDPGDGERHFDYSIIPKIDRKVIEKLNRLTRISTVEITANVGAFDSNTALGESVVDTVRAASAKRITISLHANEPHKKGSALAINPIKALIDHVRGQQEDVSKIVVTGREDAAMQDQILNLLEEKVRIQYDDRELEVLNHRYTLESKMNLLRRACRGWIQNLG
jgi:hypothetical protein